MGFEQQFGSRELCEWVRESRIRALVTRLIGTLVPDGRIIAYGVQDQEPIPVTNAMVVYSNLIWEGFGIDRWLGQHDKGEIKAMFSEIWSMVRSGIIQLPVDSICPLQQFQDALKSKCREGT